MPPKDAAPLDRTLARIRWPLRLGYLIILLLATLLESGAPSGTVSERLAEALRPSFAPRDIVDAVRNVALFAGWGLVWLVTAPPGHTVAHIRRAVATGLAISLSVETLQLFFTTRSPSVMDVFTNTTGALLGALLVIRLVAWMARGKGAKSFVGIPALVFAVAYGLAAWSEAFLPLMRQQRFPNYGTPIDRLQTALSQFSWTSLGTLPAEEFLLFAPAGFFGVAMLVERGMGYRTAAVRVSLIGAAAVVGAEVLHGFLPLPIVAGAALVHAVSIMAGAAAAMAFLPGLSRAVRGARRPLGLYGLYAATLLLWSLRPYMPERSASVVLEKLAAPWWIPMAFARERMDLFTVSDVLVGFLLHLPLGALLAVWPLRRTGWLSGILPGLLLVTGLEVLQLVVLGRTLSVDDILVAGAGLVVGWLVVRRAGFTPYGSALSTG